MHQPKQYKDTDEAVADFLGQLASIEAQISTSTKTNEWGPALQNLRSLILSTIAYATSTEEYREHAQEILRRLNEIVNRPVRDQVDLARFYEIIGYVFATIREELQIMRAVMDRSANRTIRLGAGSATTAENISTPSGGKQRTVFVIHGRDHRLRDGMFAFLRAIDLHPLEWTQCIALTRKATPDIHEILEAAFEHAQAVVALFTPDDLARLRADLLRKDDHAEENTLTGQPRPNVLFEAGMAFATHPNQTALVQIGAIRHISDLAGKHVVRMDNSILKRHELAIKLQAAGCAINIAGADWQTTGDLGPPTYATSMTDALVFEDNVYWRVKSDGFKDGPFCPDCHDLDGKEVRLKRSQGEWECAKHGYNFRAD